MTADVSFDYVVVGAGTAGCLLANRLSADPHKSVLLLEAGGDDNYHWIHIPVGYLYCIGNPRTDWCLSTDAVQGLNGRALRYPRGKVLGGCSSINGMIYMRGQSRDYDHWAQITGDDGWRWDACLAHFKRHEDHWRGGDALHGAGAEWRVEKQRLRWDVLDAFAAAAHQAGIAPVDDFNRGNNAGVGYFEVNQRRGVRWNTTKGFLKPVRQRPNLTVWTQRPGAGHHAAAWTRHRLACHGRDRASWRNGPSRASQRTPRIAAVRRRSGVSPAAAVVRYRQR